MRWTFGILCVLSLFTATGQSVSHLVLNKFSSNERGIWIRQYEGLSDELSNAYLVLGYNDTHYKGILQQQEAENWHVEGRLNGDSLQLLVTSNQDIVLGYLYGTIHDSTLQATYYTNDRLGQRTYNLKRVLKSRPQTTCGSDKWLKRLTGSLLEDRVSVLLQREEASQITGYIHFEKEAVTYDLNGRCVDGNCQNLQCTITNDLGLLLESIDLQHISGSEDLEAVLRGNEAAQLEAEVRFEMICHSRFFNGNRISYIYPYFDNKNLDNWLKMMVEEWLLGFEQVADTGAMEYRLWMDFDLISDKVLSGIMTFHNHHRTTNRTSFIFDIGSGKPISFENWVKDQTTFDEVIEGAIRSEKHRRRSFESEAARDWFDHLTFPYISMRHDGLCFRSDFSPVFGERKIVVPWSIVQDHFRRFTNIQKMTR